MTAGSQRMGGRCCSNELNLRCRTLADATPHGGAADASASASSSHTHRLLQRQPLDPCASVAPVQAQSIAANSGLAALTSKPHPQRKR